MNSKYFIKETRAGFSFIEKCALKSGGIVYGGYVRDEVIKDQSIVKFMKEHIKEAHEGKLEKFWDANYHPETSGRLLIPNDIDIAFKNEEELEEFIKKIKQNSITNKIHKYEEENLYDNVGDNIIHKKYKICSVIGKTFTNPGRIIMFNVDVCIANTEPPFYSCDMFTNCLVKDLSGIRISSASGIFIDLKPYEIIVNTGKVIDMIINRENYITILQADSIESSARIIKRISKMISKNFSIKNIPWLNKCESDEQCVICLEKKAEMSIKSGSHFDKECLFEYFEKLEYFEDNGGFFFKTPLREKCYLRFIKEWNF